MRRGRRGAALKNWFYYAAGFIRDARLSALLRPLASGLLAIFILMPLGAAVAQDWLDRLESSSRDLKEMTGRIEEGNAGSPVAALFFKECMFRDVEGACSELIRRTDPESQISNWTRGSAHRKRGEIKELRNDACGALADYRSAFSYHPFPNLEEKINALETETKGRCSIEAPQALARLNTDQGVVTVEPEAAVVEPHWVTTIELPPLMRLRKSAHRTPASPPMPVVHPEPAANPQPPPQMQTDEPQEAAAHATPEFEIANAVTFNYVGPRVATEEPKFAEALCPPSPTPVPTHDRTSHQETSALPVRPAAAAPVANAPAEAGNSSAAAPVAYRAQEQRVSQDKALRRTMLPVMTILACALGIAVYLNRRVPEWPDHVSDAFTRLHTRVRLGAARTSPRNVQLEPQPVDRPSGTPGLNGKMLRGVAELTSEPENLRVSAHSETEVNRVAAPTPPEVSARDAPSPIDEMEGKGALERVVETPLGSPVSVETGSKPAATHARASLIASDAALPRKSSLGELWIGPKLLGLIAEGSLKSIEQGSTTLLVVDGDGSLTRNVRQQFRDLEPSATPEHLLLIEPSAAHCAGLFNMFAIDISAPDALAQNQKFNAVFEVETIIYEVLLGSAFTQNNRLALRHFSRLLHALPSADLRSWFDLVAPYSLSQLGDYAMLTGHPETIRYFADATRDQSLDAFAAELRERLARLFSEPDFERLTCGTPRSLSFSEHARAGRLIILSDDLRRMGPERASALMRIFLALVIDLCRATAGGSTFKLPICLLLDNPERLFGPDKVEYQFLINELTSRGVQVMRA
jgi:hypothetical protein